MSTRITQAAGYVIFRIASVHIEYLLLQASYGDHHWSPPKGHVDPGENNKQTAIREVLEETGILKDDLKFYPQFEKIVNYEVKGKPKAVVYWLAELKNPQQKIILSREHQDYKWVPLEEACGLAKYPELQDVLRSTYEFIKEANQFTLPVEKV